MHRHFRRYCFHLAEKLGMSVDAVLTTMDSKEIAEWMAYDTTCSEEWQDSYVKEQEREKSKEMTRDEKLAAFKAMLGGSRKGE